VVQEGNVQKIVYPGGKEDGKKGRGIRQSVAGETSDISMVAKTDRKTPSKEEISGEKRGETPQ